MKVEEINKVYECCKDSFHRHCDGCPVTDDCCHDKMPLFVLKYALELLEDEEELGEELGNAVELIRKKDERIKKLLKEQEAKTQGADSGICEICSFYERALPVKPHYNRRTNWYECGACHYSMTSGMHCRSVLIPAYKVGYCAKCGKAVDWGKPTET